MEQMRDASESMDTRDERRRAAAAPQHDAERPSPKPAREGDAATNREKPARESPAQQEDVVHEASDDSSPASDPPSWIDVWL